MPRKGAVPKRRILPDPMYHSVMVAKFINRMMHDGEKSVSEVILYKALENLARNSQEDPLKAFEKAIDNVKPSLEVKSRRVGGATYQVPMEVRPDRQISLAIRWLITYSRARGEKGMVSKLSNELTDAYNNRGGAVKKREDTHRMAEANKAFAHYRW
jgi:small subunit ribosomal protein S7